MAADVTLYPAPAVEQGRLVINAATDRPLMEPLLRDFQAAHPEIAIAYVDLGTRELYESVAQTAGPAPDLAISSAMDLQAKLVNDGWTQPHVSPETLRVPTGRTGATRRTASRESPRSSSTIALA